MKTNKQNSAPKSRRSDVLAFRVTPTVASQLKELAAKDQKKLSSWLNLRAQQLIQTYHQQEQERLL